MEKQRCVPCIVELHNTVAGNNVQLLLLPWKRNNVMFTLLLLNYSMEQGPSCEAVCMSVKKFPAFYGTRKFITAFASARHLSLS